MTVADDRGDERKGQRYTLLPTVTVLTSASPLDHFTWRDAASLSNDLNCEVRLVEEDGQTELQVSGRWTRGELEEVMDMTDIEVAVREAGL